MDRLKLELKDARYFTPDQVAALLDQATGDRRWPLLFLLSRTGLRRGEALALKWKHLELDAEQPLLHVRGTLTRLTGRGLVIQPPKSKRSRRTLPLDDQAVAVLREHSTSQKRERLAAGPEWEDHGFVFTTEVGTPDDPRNVSRWAAQLMDRCELDGSLHTLRHSTASTLVAAGVPMRIVAEVLGHSSTRLTADTYSHVAPTLLADAMRRNADAIDSYR